jgi:hypothetical protein
MKVEIFEKATGKVIETQEVRRTLRPFLFYWRSNCNTKDYSYRVVK